MATLRVRATDPCNNRFFVQDFTVDIPADCESTPVSREIENICRWFAEATTALSYWIHLDVALEETAQEKALQALDDLQQSLCSMDCTEKTAEKCEIIRKALIGASE